MSSRRSQRVAAKSSAIQEKEVSDDDFIVDEEGAPAGDKPRGKKRKAPAKPKQANSAPKKARGSRGMLKYITEMPLDVVYEIFSQLEPIDLVQLSKASKDLKALLTGPSSNAAWKAARANISPPMPACPEDMKEVDYAELAFGKCCHYCLRKIGTIFIAWYARRRICKKCLPNYCSLGLDVPPNLSQKLQPNCVVDIVPTLVADSCNSRRHRRGYQDTYYFPEYYKIYEEEFTKLTTPEEKKQWWTYKAKTQKEHVSLCLEWCDKYWAQQRAEVSEVTEKRKTLIAERVMALGWSDEVNVMPDFQQKFQECADIVRMCHKEVTAKILSDLEPRINTFMEAVKVARLSRERQQLIRARLPVLKQAYTTCVSNIPFTDRLYFPRASELYLEPSVMDLILNTPKNTILTEGDFTPILSTIIPDVQERLRHRFEDELLAHVRSAQKINAQNTVQNADAPKVDVRKANAPADTVPTSDCAIDRGVLDLATTVFQCTCPYSGIHHEALVWHSCEQCRTYPDDIELRDRTSLSMMINADVGYRSFKDVDFALADSKFISHLLKLCGLDPLTTTKKEMDELNPVFECVECNDEYRGRPTMTWMAAVNHYKKAWPHRKKLAEEVQMELLVGEEADLVRARIAEEQARDWGSTFCRYMTCAHCGDANHRGRPALKTHLRNAHDINVATEKDFVVDPRVKNHPDPFYIWPPRVVPEVIKPLEDDEVKFVPP